MISGIGLVLSYAIGLMIQVRSALSFPNLLQYLKYEVFKGDTDAAGVGLNMLNF